MNHGAQITTRRLGWRHFRSHPTYRARLCCILESVTHCPIPSVGCRPAVEWPEQWPLTANGILALQTWLAEVIDPGTEGRTAEQGVNPGDLQGWPQCGRQSVCGHLVRHLELHRSRHRPIGIQAWGMAGLAGEKVVGDMEKFIVPATRGSSPQKNGRFHPVPRGRNHQTTPPNGVNLPHATGLVTPPHGAMHSILWKRA